MATARLFQIDAFTSQVFRGNPAAVCLLPGWPDDGILQAIAEENNLAETAFLVPDETTFELRWFSPRHEVPLCGHATLASAFVLFRELRISSASVCVKSRSGLLQVVDNGEMFSMDFPTYGTISCASPPTELLEGLGTEPDEVFRVEEDPNYFAIYESEKVLRGIRPNLTQLEAVHPYGIAVSSPGMSSDCASRYFAPSYGIPEDPVTGSIHCVLTPYWCRRLDKSKIHARQVSSRGGELFCELTPNRVRISGRAVKYLEGSIHF